jgi:hypothetical protein
VRLCVCVCVCVCECVHACASVNKALETLLGALAFFRFSSARGACIFSTTPVAMVLFVHLKRHRESDALVGRRIRNCENSDTSVCVCVCVCVCLCVCVCVCACWTAHTQL